MTDTDDDESLFDSPKKDRKIHRQKTLKGGHSGSVFCLVVNSDILVSGSFDHSVCVWDRHRNFELLCRLKDRHGDMVYGVSVNNLNQFVSCSHDSTGLARLKISYFLSFVLLTKCRKRFYIQLTVSK